MGIQIISFEECMDKDYGETLVQYKQGDVVSFAFSAVDVRDAEQDPGLLVADLMEQLEEEKERHGEVVRPLWSELSENLLKEVLYNPFDMHFVEYGDYPDVNEAEAMEDAFFDEVSELGLDGAITCGEDGAVMTVYAGAMGSINWAGHSQYGVPCFEHEVEKEVEKQPYRIVITETYVREVEIYAEDSLMAEQIAEDLCNNSVIDLGCEDFHERSTECLGVARESDLKLHEVYGDSGRITTNSVKLLDEQISEAMRQVDNNRASGAPDREPEL